MISAPTLNGSAALGNADNGVYIDGASSNTIGGIVAGAENLLSGNGEYGLFIYAQANQTLVEGNFVGTNAAGTGALANSDGGLYIDDAAGNTIGGASAGAANIISGNYGDGLILAPASQTLIEGNFIGTTAGGAALGNGSDGVLAGYGSTTNTIGGTNSGAGNLIAFNGGNGVTVGSNDTDASTGDSVLENAIYANGKLGIDLGDDGVTLNGSEGHSGPNLFQDFPVLSSAIASNGTTTITGSLTGTPGSTYRVEFFSNPAASPSGYGQGQTFLGFVSVPINSSGTASLSITLANVVAVGQFITTTATDPAGNTSEFSADLLVQSATTTVVASSSNPSVFGQTVTLMATVSPTTTGQAAPTGSVAFFDGAIELGTATLSNGIANFSTAALVVGSHSITAQYLGDTNFVGSASPVVSQTVAQASTSTSLAASPASSVFGQSVTFIAAVAVSAPGSGTPTGSITFDDGTTVLGISALSRGVATFSTTSLGVETHSITAAYNGDGNFFPSTSAVLSQVVNLDSTSTALTASINPAVFGQSVTFTATVTANAPGAGTPTGTISFMEGSTTLDTETLGHERHGQLQHLSARSRVSHDHGGLQRRRQFPHQLFVHNRDDQSGEHHHQPDSLADVHDLGPAHHAHGDHRGRLPRCGRADGVCAVLQRHDLPGHRQPERQYRNSHDDYAAGRNRLAHGGISGRLQLRLSTSSAVSVTIDIATTTTLSSATNPSVFGQSVTFAATVTPSSGSGTPTGTVTFYDGSTALAPRRSAARRHP